MWALVYKFKGFSLLFAFLEVYSVTGVCFFKGWQYDNGHTVSKKQPYLMEAERLVVHRKSQYV